jgi:hypothetical protein
MGTPAPVIRTAGSGRRCFHSLGLFPSSTPWGERSYPGSLHSVLHHGEVRPAQPPVHLWATVVHRLWRTERPSTRRQSCPRVVPRTRAVVPRFSPVLHSDVPSSTTSIRISPMRVKAATQCCRGGWGEVPQNLGTVLGTTWGQPNWPVGKPWHVHRRRSFSTGCVPSQCGQKMAADQPGKGLSTVSTTPTTTTRSRELRIDQKAGGGQICGQAHCDASSRRLRPISLGCRWSTSDCPQQQTATGAATGRSGGSSPTGRVPTLGTVPNREPQRTPDSTRQQQHTGGGYR